MDNKLSSLINYDLKFGRKEAPYRVFATWNIHYACNYKCTYCHAPKPEHKDARKAVYIDSGSWIDIWKKNYEEYGTWEILISGGEPFTYPGFMKLLPELSKMHIISVCTNLEWDVSYFVEHITPGRVRIETSFHPESAKLDKFSKKLKVLKDKGFEPTVNFVPWPPLLGIMRKVKESVEGAGCKFTLQPFIGEFENRSYPQGYTNHEKEHFKIFKDDCNLRTLEFKTTGESDSTKGKLCRMGQNYCFIHPDGETSRCCRDHSIALGNIINGTFKLLEQPAVCNARNCNCWRCMLAGREDFWVRHWGRAEITDLATNKQIAVNNRDKFRISLIQPPVWGLYGPPVSLAQISSCLREKSFNVSVFDINIDLYNKRKNEYETVWAIEQSAFWANPDNVKKFFSDNKELIDDCVDRISASKPNLAGFSVNVCSLPATIELAKLIKQKFPSVKIVVGGPMFFVAFNAADILAQGCIDIIVCGEGEEAFCELADLVNKQEDLRSCKGIYFKENGKVVKTEERQLIKDLDKLPFLDLESFPDGKYESPGHLKKHISLMTSRGCILNCAYCGPKAYWKGFRFMSGKRIYDEVRHHVKNDPAIEHIEFLDLELNGNIKALDEFCELMISNPPKEGLCWHANIVIRPEMSRELLCKMKKAGCNHLSIGIETGSQRMLDFMRKRYKITDAEIVLKAAHESGIHVTTNFMFGFPAETQEDFDLTLEFLRRNANVIGTVYPSRSFFTIEPFSYVSEHMDEFGIVGNQDNNLYWESLDAKNNYPERLRRCEEFSKLALELGVSVGLGLQTSLELDRYYSMGFYYESKKDSVKAASFFEKYLKLDPKNSIINMKLQSLKPADSVPLEPAKSAPESNGSVSFNWDITSICNYRCPYCWFYGKWVQMKRHNLNIPAEKLKEFWGRIYKRYGSIKIFITGGEPFLYPEFSDLIINLKEWHTVGIVTNLSWPVKTLGGRIKSPNINILPSFHPLFADFTEFTDKLIFLKEKGLAADPSLVAWPPQIPRIKYYAKKFKEFGADLFVQPFFGEYKGIKYPDGYSEAERQEILPFLGERGGKPFETISHSTKGKLCYAGSRYGVIHSDGIVLRCGGIHSEDAKVGSILDQDFKLFTQAYPCTSEVCPCNEWASLIKE